MKKQFTEYGPDELLKEMYALDARRTAELVTIREEVSGLRTTVAETGTEVFNEIANILDNSHPEWSKDAYTTLGITPATAGDGNLEAYNWYRELYSETDITVDAVNPLKAAKTIEPADHTLWAANEGANADIPRWDKTNARIEMGGTVQRWDLFVPVPNDIVFPGNVYRVQFEAMLRSATALPAGLQAYCGFWDNTAGQRKWVEGGSFTITGSIFGDQSGSTTVSYKILARTDSGEEAISNTLTFTNAPATFSQTNHPRINFSGVAGFIEFEIYRQIGSEFVLQYIVRNSIEGSYYDVGNPPVRVVSGFPVISATKPKAFAQTTTFQPGSLNGTSFVRHDMTVFVPTTYDRSVTGAGMQFFRFGFSALCAEARQIYVRRFGLSQGYGVWSRSANDVRQGAHSSPSTTATGSPGGSGGINPDPPDPGGGGSGCTLLDTPQSVYDENGNIIEVPLEDIIRLCKERPLYADSCGFMAGKIVGVKIAYASEIRYVTTANGLRRGFTFNHPFLMDYMDHSGTAVSMLGVGAKIWTKIDGRLEQTTITEIEIEFGSFRVGIPVQEGSHVCVLGGFVSDNEKNES